MVVGSQRVLYAVILVVMMASVSWLPCLGPAEEEALEEVQHQQQTWLQTQSFASNNGFTHINLTQEPGSGLTALERPPVSWTMTSGMGLTSLRTGACSAYLPSTNEVFLVGGRSDVDPSQTGDESNTNLVEIFDVANKTWRPSSETLKSTQQYHKCAVAGGKIYAVGDHHPYASPSVEATGLVQVYDPSAGNWSYGTSMPGNQSVGLAGVSSLNGQIYVAGGVALDDRSDSTDRLLRYDPVNDSWTQLANMNNERHSFELVAFRGKLIAYGGVAVFFDPISNTTVESETNLTEAYDPVTNSWSQLPNATYAFSAYAATVFNDEIIIHGGYEQSGWSGTANDKTYGYDPFTNHWNTHATLQIGIYDSTIVTANDTLVYAGGDTSNTRFSSWSVQYLAENEYHVNPDDREGWLISGIQDLRSSLDGSASLIWLGFTTIEPAGTSIGVQYRTADSLQGISSSSWLPTTVPINTFLTAGNTSLAATFEDAFFLQYRVLYTTQRVMEWISPTLVEVNIGADSAGFVGQIPTSMQPTSTPITIATEHQATTQEGTYVLSLHPSNEFGSLDMNSDWLTMTWNTTTETLSTSDPDGLVFNSQASAVVVPSINGETVNWTFSLAGTVPTDYLRIKTSTHAERNVTFLHPDTITIDRAVSLDLLSITADRSSKGDSSVEEGEVLPRNALLNLTIDHFFTNSGLRLLGGDLQARLHLDLETYNLDVDERPIWSNLSSEWFNLPAGQVEYAEINVPESLSGEMHVWFEARTSEDWDLEYSTEPWTFIVNGESPTLLSLTPPLDGYINEDRYQSVSFEFYDVGGFSNETLDAYVWLEAVNDGTNGEPLDGIAQRLEYQSSPYYLHENQNQWLVNVTVNDTVNDDQQEARVLLEGTDLAGFNVPLASAEDGHARWISRTPSKGDLVLFEPTTNLFTPSLMRFEPSQKIGWNLAVEDTNGLSDIAEVRIELGNDENLGIKYTVVDNTCSSLDERLLLDPSDCLVDTSNGMLELDVQATVEWSLTLSGLIQGEVDVLITDYDGTQRFDFSEAWLLERGMLIEIESLRDDDGAVKQAIENDVAVMAGDRINITASILHRTSSTPYTGDLRLRWDGLLQNDPWKGAMSVSIVDGHLVASIPTPETSSGLIHGLAISLWDPLETESLASVDVSPFYLDHEAPELLPSTIDASISRYHLDEVNVGVNINEAQGWSGALTLTCEVRSMNAEWEPQTLVRNATTEFDGRTMFSFTYDFSQSGDPSALSAQASLVCWAEGTDDAGWNLASNVGNTALDPWLEAPLNNVGPDLSLESVEVDSEVKAGEKVRLSFFVVNAGEGLDTPFNATIEVVQGEERTLVGRAIFYSIEENTAKSVKRTFAAPEGEWTLEITVDLEQHIWEIDEANNVFSEKITTEGEGLGALAVVIGGGGLLALLGALLVLRARRPSPVEVEKVVAAIEATVETVVKDPETKPKRRGPPGGKIAASSGAKPSRGPPRGPPKKSTPPVAASPQEVAAKYFDALGGSAPEENGLETVEDYSKLPGGGEYEYTPDGTFYVGETCGRWTLNEDKSFTKISE